MVVYYLSGDLSFAPEIKISKEIAEGSGVVRVSGKVTGTCDWKLWAVGKSEKVPVGSGGSGELIEIEFDVPDIELESLMVSATRECGSNATGFAAELKLEFEDGSSEYVHSNSDWKLKEGSGSYELVLTGQPGANPF